MTLGQNGVLRYGHYSDVNAGQNKLEVHIYQFAENGHQLARNRPDATLATWTLFGHNLVIFHPILTLFISKCLFFKGKSKGDNNLALFPLVQILVFALVFAPRPHMGSIARMDPKLPSKCWDVSWPSPPTPSSKYFFPK